MLDVTEEETDYLILPATASTLQEICAFHVALELFRRNWIVPELTPSRDQLRCLFGAKVVVISSILAKMQLPDKFREMIMAKMYSIDMHLGCWTWAEENACYSVDFGDRNAFVYFPRCCDDIVWRYDDLSINVEPTVKNILRCDEFNHLQKFKLACAYCLEDEIEQLLPSISSVWDPDVISLISNRYVRYWVEEKMIEGIPPNSQDDMDIIKLLSEYNRPAYQYYWNRLESQHQVEVILHFIESDTAFPFEYLLPTLNLQQWFDLVDEYPDNIMFHLMRKYARNDRKKENILRIWNYISDMVNDDIFRLMIRICCEHNCEVDEDCLHRQIWVQSPNHLKDPLLSELFSLRCRALLDSTNVPSFFTTDLRSVCFKKKSVYFRKRSIAIAQCYSSADFERLLTWCFTEKELKSFKTKLLDDVERSIEYEFDFTERDRLLDFFSCINRL